MNFTTEIRLFATFIKIGNFNFKIENPGVLGFIMGFSCTASTVLQEK